MDTAENSDHILASTYYHLFIETKAYLNMLARAWTYCRAVPAASWGDYGRPSTCRWDAPAAAARHDARLRVCVRVARRRARPPQNLKTPGDARLLGCHRPSSRPFHANAGWASACSRLLRVLIRHLLIWLISSPSLRLFKDACMAEV